MISQKPNDQRLDPAPYFALILQVLFAKLSLQVSLFPFNYSIVHNNQYYRKKEDGPECIGEKGDSEVDGNETTIDWVACEPIRPGNYDHCSWFGSFLGCPCPPECPKSPPHTEYTLNNAPYAQDKRQNGGQE